MKYFIVNVLILLYSGILYSQDSTRAEPKYEMTTYVMGFLLKGSTWSAEETPELEKLQNNHVAHIFSLINSGKAAIAGPFLDENEIRGIIIFNTDSLEEAQAWEFVDPAIQSGRLSMKFIKWFAAKGIMKPADTPIVFSTYYFGLLKKGPAWTPEQTDETKKIQEGHMANIHEMAKKGKLVLAGPFIDGGDNRGVFFFRTESLEEAQELCSHDPAIQAGRLVVELHPWMIAKGSLREDLK